MTTFLMVQSGEKRSSIISFVVPRPYSETCRLRVGTSGAAVEVRSGAMAIIGPPTPIGPPICPICPIIGPPPIPTRPADDEAVAVVGVGAGSSGTATGIGTASPTGVVAVPVAVMATLAGAPSPSWPSPPEASGERATDPSAAAEVEVKPGPGASISTTSSEDPLACSSALAPSPSASPSSASSSSSRPLGRPGRGARGCLSFAKLTLISTPLTLELLSLVLAASAPSTLDVFTKQYPSFMMTSITSQ
mmetsp:Transcript_43022/g.116017  ORF Transcript_43022/g.116017 Transcript_43022/m.116017 type:complete len:248 (-) Transcript_43022:741-1484(-)